MGKGKLDFIFVGVGDRNDSVARPHWASHPLPFLNYLPVGLKYVLRILANVLPRQSVSPRISWSIRSDGFIESLCLDSYIWMLCTSLELSCSMGSALHDLLSRSRNKPSKDMAFPHPKSRKQHHRNDYKPNTAGVLWNFFKRTINITEYRNAEDDVKPAENRTLGDLFHDYAVPPFIGDIRKCVGRHARAAV